MVSAMITSAGDPSGLPRPLAGPGRWLRVSPFLGLAFLGLLLALLAPTHRTGAVLVAGALAVAIVLAVAVLPWSRWPAAWHAVPIMALYPLTALLTYAVPDADSSEFLFMTALPVIWLALFHSRRVLVVGLVLLAVTLFGPPLAFGGAYPARWGDTAMSFVLSCLGGLAGHYLISRNRQFAAEAQAATRQAQTDRDLMNAYLDHAGSLVIVVDTQGRVTLFNKFAEQVTGYRAEEVLGGTMWHAGREPARIQELFGQVLAGGPAFQYEGDTFTKTGERRRIAWNVAGLTGDAGEVTYVVGTGADVTELRSTERLLANVLGAATQQMIMATDTEGTFTVFNIGAERHLGYTAEEMIGVRNVEVIHVPEELAALVARTPAGSFREMLRLPQPADDLVLVQEWTLVRKDGSRFPAQLTVNTIRDEGEHVGYAVVAHDITAQKQAEAAMADALAREREASDRLRELDQVKSDFVATVSHDLRTPLTSIVGNTELLLDGDAGELGEMQRRLLGAVDRNARRLHTLVGDLLLLSRIESGAIRMHPRDVSVNELVEGTLEAVAGQRAADVRLEVELPEKPVLARGDPNQLERVFTNLVGNALKFTPPGGRVTISVTAGPERIEVRVSDTGIGIPEAELPNIFDRFFRSSRSQQANRPGSGLGLTIAKSIIEQHGGGVAASANPEGGTTFTVTLPSLAAAEAAEAAEASKRGVA